VSKSPPLVGPEYLQRFTCIADHCEDTCCAGLKVPVDAYGRGRMREALAAEGMPVATFDQLVPLNVERDDPEQAAFIQMNEKGRCPFLDERQLCSVHRKHGNSVLANACAMFPRSVIHFPDRREVAGSFACPEIVRLALLTESPLEPLPLPPGVVPRDFVNRKLDADAGTAYATGRDAVRAVVMHLLSSDRFPPGSRLVFLGQLGHWLRPFYYRGAPPYDKQEMEEKLHSVESSSLLLSIHRNFAKLELLTDKWIALFLSILEERLRAGAPVRLVRVAEGVLETYGGPNARGLTARYRKVVNKLQHGDFGARLERYFRRHAMAWWYRNPHTDSEHLTAHVFKLAFRAAMLRVMLMGHPDTAPFMLDSPDPSGDSLDGLAVEVVQLFSKHLELSSDVQHWTSRLSESADVFANLVVVAKLL
jgi:lysine-N-methylase